jgi:hypothetical protein
MLQEFTQHFHADQLVQQISTGEDGF